MEKEEIARGYTIGGVFGESWQSIGLENFSISIIENPALVKKVISLFDNFYDGIVEEILHQFKVDFIWSCDNSAFRTGPFLLPEQFKEFILPFILKELKR
ncbi:MAG TPA: hypothetical protein EYP78_02810 [Candidatus Omnitrophica bacterium]|nr:hypothetical protein [Candidatus Omnitrophota bacterium]